MFDCFVIGGGPAGLAAAIAARMRGLNVAVADPEKPPIDKACGEGLMPDSLQALKGLGVEVEEREGHGLRGIRFVQGQSVATADFPVGRGVGMRRLLLHERLIEQAEACGVRLLWGTRVTGVSGQTVEMDGERAGARWIVGADGQHSRVRQWAGLGECARESRRYGFRRHYAMAPWSEYVEIYWGRACQIYVTPVSAGEVCVAVISRDAHLRLDEAMAGLPEVAERLGSAVASTVERGSVSATRKLRRVARRNVALVGDASGSVDAVTGEGLCLSFKQAVGLAGAMAAGGLADYEAMHARLRRRAAGMGEMMLLMDRFGWVRGRAVAAMAARPEIFAEMVRMHVGESAAGRFVRGAMVPLGWGMVRGIS